MNRGRSIVLPWLLAASALALLPATLGAGISKIDPGADAAHAVLERMAERNPGLHSYQSRVHVDVRMLSFPYLAPNRRNVVLQAARLLFGRIR